MIHFHDFTKVTGVPKRRSTFGYKPKHLFSLYEGQLYPFFCQEALPSDIWKAGLGFCTRSLQPFVHPVLDDVYQDFYWFFVPYRILWKHWEQFCGVDEPSAYTTPVEYVIPSLVGGGGAPLTVYPGSIANGLGAPVGSNLNGTNILPFAAFIKIWSDWFRDENLQDKPAVLETMYNLSSNGTINLTAVGLEPGNASYPEYGFVCKYHDLFTSCLPKPYKGPEVTIPLGSTAPLKALPADYKVSGSDANYGIQWNTANGNVPGVLYQGSLPGMSVDSSIDVTGDTITPIQRTNLVVDLSNAASSTLNDLRQTIALGLYFECLSLGGSRYTELMRSMFGESPRDARLQRAEYLGGSHNRLNIQQVSAQGQSGTPGTAAKSNAGSLGAFSVTSNFSRDFIKHIEEPGLVLGLTAIRVKHTYAQGMPKLFKKHGRFDFYWPQFDRLGNVPVMKTEIYHNASASDVFGFQEAHYEYRHMPNRVSGSLAAQISGGFVSNADSVGWTFQDVYTASPTLSSGWIKEDMGRVGQTLAGTGFQFGCDTEVKLQITRPMSVTSIPSSLGM